MIQITIDRQSLTEVEMSVLRGYLDAMIIMLNKDADADSATDLELLTEIQKVILTKITRQPHKKNLDSFCPAE